VYRCEHVGLFDTYSIDNRVRYTGELHDPNEVALTLSAAGIALLLGFSLRRRRPSAHLLTGLGIALMLATVWLTKSRGGLIAAMLVPGVYVIRRYGWRAILPALMVAVPVLMLGGRSDENAAVSTQLRYEAWAAGLRMFQHSPIWGVGARMFTDHHYLTAHNSYVLTLAEMGIVGMFLFISIIYLCIKTLVVGLGRLRHIPGTAAAQVWGMALLSAMSGIAFQINTLSFAYHSVLWLFFGLVGAWYSAIKHHMPEVDIKIRLPDVAAIAGIVVGYAFIALPLYLRYKGEL
jgi:O-antigen ligase